MSLTDDDLRGAIARAYCHPGCTDIELDTKLIEAAVIEVRKILPASAPEGARVPAGSHADFTPFELRAAALSAEPKAQAQAAETAWLIEVLGFGKPLYFDASHENGVTDDASKAVRFPTKEAAYKVFADLRDYGPNEGKRRKWFAFDLGVYRITEHMWPAPDSWRMRVAAIAAECSDPDTTDALDKLLEEVPLPPAPAAAEPASTMQLQRLHDMLVVGSQTVRKDFDGPSLEEAVEGAIRLASRMLQEKSGDDDEAVDAYIQCARLLDKQPRGAFPNSVVESLEMLLEHWAATRVKPRTVDDETLLALWDATALADDRVLAFGRSVAQEAAPSPKQQGAAHWTREHHIALREAHCIESSNAFFEARGQGRPTQLHALFDAAFCRGFDAAVKAKESA